MITEPTSPMIPVTLSCWAATSIDQDGSTYASSPNQSPPRAAPAKDVAFAVITVTLPLLRRMTSPGNVRFE